MEQKENRKVRYTKMVIRDSLMELMKNKSILRISIKEICCLADISRSTFYDHYKDQYDLLRQIEEEVLVYLESLLNKHGEKSGIQVLQLILEEFLIYIANNIFVQVLLSEHGDIDFQKKIFKNLTLRKQITKFFPKKMQNDESLPFYLAYVINGGIGMVQYWLKNNMPVSAPQLAKMIIKFRTTKI